jgi:hypothetical protein
MKVSGHSKQIGGIYFAADSDGDSDDDETEIRLKANKSRVGRIFSRNRETHDRLARSLHDAEMCFTTASSSLSALAVTKIGDDVANRRADLERYMQNEEAKRKELMKASEALLGYHRAHGAGDASMWGAGMRDGEDDDAASLEDAPRSAPAPGSYAEMHSRMAAMEAQKQGMRTMIEQQRAAAAEKEGVIAQKDAELRRVQADLEAARDQVKELKNNTERMQRQLIYFLERQDDPDGEKEVARVPDVTSQVAQSICALYE